MKRFKIIFETEIETNEIETNSQIKIDNFVSLINQFEKSKKPNSLSHIIIKEYNTIIYEEEILDINDLWEIYKKVKNNGNFMDS
jgi:hypothetical protein